MVNETKLRLFCWAHDLQEVVRRAVKGKHAGEYRLACGCWRGATVPEQAASEQPT